MALAVTCDHRVERVVDVTFDSTNGVDLMADLYLPRSVDGPAPVIIWVHGGGWRFGDRKLAPDLDRFFARRGFAMVSIDYRLSDRAEFPAPVEDLKTAIRWMRSVADRYGLNPQAIGLWGSSAGGHLATVAATSGPGAFETAQSPHANYSSDVQAVVAGYAPADFLRMDEQRDASLVGGDEDPEGIRSPAGARSTDADSFESRLVGGPIAERLDAVRRASPLNYVAAGQPPLLLLHGLHDAAVPWQQSELLFTAASAKGNDVTLMLVERLGHGFLNRSHLDEGRTWTRHERTRNPDGSIRITTDDGPIFDRVETFFRHHLAPASAQPAAKHVVPLEVL